jgi:hypothetical protein
MGRIDIAGIANRRIRDFVTRAANARLRPGTGYYSTPFRGSLFGEKDSAAVANRLAPDGIDALWLGTNPGVSRSLEYILQPPRGRGDFPTFERQAESGLFGSWLWGGDDEGPAPDWNPIERPKGNWRVYRDALARVARLDRVAMANFLPWGSRSADALIGRIGLMNRPLLDRMLEFADDLNAEITGALAPKLVVVPFSLGRNPVIDSVRPLGLSIARAAEARRHSVAVHRGTFTFHTGICASGRHTVRTAFLPHAASLRLRSDDRRRIIDRLAQVLGEDGESWRRR